MTGAGLAVLFLLGAATVIIMATRAHPLNAPPPDEPPSEPDRDEDRLAG